MTPHPERGRVAGESDTPEAADGSDAAILAEDLLLLLFQPDSGTIAGEGTLFYALAGAVLADLALDERVTARTTRIGTVRVQAVEGLAPSDGVLRAAWDHVSDRPRKVQSVLAAIGPPLRQRLLERLVTRGDIRRRSRRVFGLFPTTVLADGGNGRRADLLRDVRGILVDRAEPTPRVGALATLLLASGTLPQFDPEIPWSSSVITRAQELERGSWSAQAATRAVVRTTIAIISSSTAATDSSPRS